MANEKHVYMVVRGNWTSATLAAESWQFGIRLFADTSVPNAADDLPTTGDFDEGFETRTDTIGTATTNWTWSEVGSEVFSPTNYLIEQAMPAVVSLFSSAGLSAFCRALKVRLIPYLGPAGPVEGMFAEGTFASPPVGVLSGELSPLEVACCVSLRTQVLGRRGRGRFFLPGIAESQVDSTGFFSSSAQSTYLTGAAAFVNGLKVSPAGPSLTHVVPIVTGSPWSHYGKVNRVDIGNVPDSQRRRRRSLVESRTGVAIT